MGKAFVKHLDEVVPAVPPRHINSQGWSLVTPAMTGTDTVNVFSITEIRQGGAALQDMHPNNDHCYYILSGRGYSIIEGKRYEYKVGDVMWIPGNKQHEMYPIGDETLRFAVTLSSKNFVQTEPFIRNVSECKSMVPNAHFDFYAIPLVNPKNGGGDTIEFVISECMPGGRAEKDVHEDADHVYYFLSGNGYTICDGEKMEVKPGTALYVPMGTTHELHGVGDQALTMIVTFFPARKVMTGK